MTVSKLVREIWEQPKGKAEAGGRLVDLPEKPHKKKKIKALRPSDILNKKRTIYDFEGRFLDSFGRPEKHAKWFITGPSFSGKSSFVFTLCDYLADHGLIDYNNHEEAGGDAQTVADKIEKHVRPEVRHKIRLYKAAMESDTHETMLDRMMKKASADFGVIDSVQHAELSKRQYLNMTDKLCSPRKGKSLIFINHWIKNDYTKFLKHDCDVKIEVIGFVAYVESRYGGNKPFVIWEQGAKDYWRKKYTQVIRGKYWPGKKK
ncbi:hypothetical protein ABDK00_017035 [Niabella insulamsoli]|uniref:hypothetical protein n=1 Tax=Niabella insulamsoli TaxID=3144874 RepID=UPI0031FD2A34